jgi:cysteine desulfurase
MWEEVSGAMLPCLREEFGKPSSLYSIGARARRPVELAREKAASALGGANRDIAGE